MEEMFLKKSICIFVISLFAFFMASALPVLAQEEGGTGGETPPAEEPPVEEPPAEPPPEEPPIEPPPEEPPVEPPVEPPPVEPPVECPVPPSPIQCGSNENQIRDVDDRGCTTGYHCEPFGATQPACPQAPPAPPQCGQGEKLEANYDNMGCLMGYICKAEGTGPICPTWQPPMPVCNPTDKPVADFDKNGCLIGWHCEYAGGPEPPPPQPPPTPPQGCREEKDPQTGFVRVICEGPSQPVCPEIPPEEERRCVEKGGTPRKATDPRGCIYIDCMFGGGGGFLQTPQYCPSELEIKEHMQKCEEMGVPGRIIMEGGCKVVRCEFRKEEECPPITYEQKEAVFKRCESIGKTVTEAWDERGCRYLKCAEEGECLRLPPDAFRKCEEMGGELVAKDDERGCVVWHECVMRGREEMVSYESIERVPETTELLDIAFKLESLRIELDRLARRSDDIADYYQSTGSSEAERFRRVADMFEAAKDKVDEIKSKIRERLEGITIGDLMEIKRDINYIKDVIIKDILYLMLSTGEDIERRIEKKEEGDCGTDGSCFDRAVRMCEQVVFRPEGEQGPVVKITGLEGDACVLDVRLPPGVGPPEMGEIYMVCKIKKYALGIRGSEDVIPYCEGPMKELMASATTQAAVQKVERPFVMCTPEDERAFKDCGNRGGMPQSDPSPDGRCEIYTGCEMPVCGDTICERGRGESYENCPQDCVPEEQLGAPGQSMCGNRICEDMKGESYYNCPQDCMPPGPSAGGGGGSGMPCSGCLNNGVCDPGECSECPDCMGGGI